MLRVILASILMTVPVLAMAQNSKTTMEVIRQEINAEQLWSWYEQDVDMVVVDARTKAYFNGTLLPDAEWLPARSTAEQIQATFPEKDGLVVVYCLGVTCPASKILYDQLMSLGYTNVYEYHEGLQDWQQKGYPVTQIDLGGLNG